MSSKYGRCLAQRSVEMNLCVKKADEIKSLQQAVEE